jgi:hypothetical protein
MDATGDSFSERGTSGIGAWPMPAVAAKTIVASDARTSESVRFAIKNVRKRRAGVSSTGSVMR